jgi:endonuclease G, mitochondrial
MPFRYLADGERRELQRTILDLVGYDIAVRASLISVLPSNFSALLPQFAQPALQLQGDLNKFNTTERLRDGTVPFVLWLQEFLSLYGELDGAQEIHRRLEQITRIATGAPEVQPVTKEEEKEAVVHQDDMVPLQFLQLGISAARAVAKIEVARFDNGKQTKAGGRPVIFLGTGWLVAQRLLCTNYHVFNARTKGEPAASADDFKLQANNATLTFDYDADGIAGFRVAVESVAAADAVLDYTLVRIAAAGRPPLPIFLGLPEPKPGHGAAAVNIVQHPNGDPKKLAIRNNLIASATANDLRYFTDTLGGSSGSPVMDDEWRVVALHRGHTFASGVKFQGKTTAYLNVGTRISAIMAHLRANFAGQIAELNI